MTPAKRRSKTISLRVSEEEYNSLLEVCRALGYHSLSDFARDTIVGALGPRDGGAQDVLAKLHDLQRNLADLEQRIVEFIAKLD
jgi:hypothetical protein